MSVAFKEADHPRGHGGKFTVKEHGAQDADLSTDAGVEVTPHDRDVFEALPPAPFKDGYTPVDVTRTLDGFDTGVAMVWEKLDEDGLHGDSELFVRTEGEGWSQAGPEVDDALYGEGPPPQRWDTPDGDRLDPATVIAWDARNVVVDPSITEGTIEPGAIAARREARMAKAAQWPLARAGMTEEQRRNYEYRGSDMAAAAEKVGYADAGELLRETHRIAGDRRGPMCERHGGRWGYDDTCEDCTSDDGEPRPIPEKLDPVYWEEQAAGSARASADSFERSDTDGFMTQWASDLTASKYRLQADICRNGGKAQFPALFTADGQPVRAELKQTPYGEAWMIRGENPGDPVTWVNPSQAKKASRRNAAMAKKGYREGFVWAPAKADLGGGGSGLAGAMSVRPVIRRTSHELEDTEFSGWDENDWD